MKDIKGYEGLYAITSCGRVWSYRRKKFLSPGSTNGYLTVVLSNNGNRETFLVHRLVALAYIPNIENKPEVNHKDEIRNHNWINNLEWVTTEENLNYGTRKEKVAIKRGKPVYCEELDQVFYGIREAARALNLRHQCIYYCCHGKQKTTGGYHFRFIEETK